MATPLISLPLPQAAHRPTCREPHDQLNCQERALTLHHFVGQAQYLPRLQIPILQRMQHNHPQELVRIRCIQNHRWASKPCAFWFCEAACLQQVADQEQCANPSLHPQHGNAS